MPYLPCIEPSFSVLFPLSVLLLLLNLARCLLDHLLYCGLIGQIIVGVSLGMPVAGTQWLSLGVQEAIQAFGFIGLVGMVFEGGFNTDLSLLCKSALVSIMVAVVGPTIPIALSFCLLGFRIQSSTGMAHPTILATFSAGAALCSTSLGTTFAIPFAANMQKTRIGVILIGGAMMDDVVGLVMVNVITELGQGASGLWSILGPIAGSCSLLAVTAAISPLILKKIWKKILVMILTAPRPGGSLFHKIVEALPTTTTLASYSPHSYCLDSLQLERPLALQYYLLPF